MTVATIFVRSWRTVLRRPMILLLSFVQPVIWMLFFGFLFQRFDVSGFGGDLRYLDFLVPGVCAMTVLFGASQSGIPLIRDIQTGMFDRMRATPASRAAFYGGKIAADVSRLLLQALAVAVIGVLLGARLHPDPGATLLALAALALFGALYAGVSCIIAVRTRSRESMSALVHLVNLPVFFTSTALVPAKQMPDWLSAISSANPLSLVVNLLRAALL